MKRFLFLFGVFLMGDAVLAAAAESDTPYHRLRHIELVETYTVENLTLKRDAGVLRLQSGRVSFSAPVMERVVLAVFRGEGRFELTPAIPVEADYLRLLTGEERVQESFERLVLWFTDDSYQEIVAAGQSAPLDVQASKILRDFRKRVRHRAQKPRSLVERLIAGESVENIEAEILGQLYQPDFSGSFSAYFFGKEYNDLRFHVRPGGVLPQLPAAQEVALLNLDPGDDQEGIWYLAHLQSEYKNGKARCNLDGQIIDVEHYRIQTTIDGDRLNATAEITFSALRDGDRVLNFGLLPSLRVTGVEAEGKSDIDYIQEDRKEDGSFYIVLPEPLARGEKHRLSVKYEGKEVLEDAGGGNFAVRARTSWYPSVNAFGDRATFDLTFKVPKHYKLVGVGKLIKEWKEEDLRASQWVSEVPLAVAGFNYGRFKKKQVKDDTVGFEIEGYATSRLPDYLKGAEEIGGMSPTRLTENAMVDAQNSLRIFSHWFGPLPYGRIAITQQPQFNFGQSWPTLVYLPIVAFFDSTQRWRLLDQLSSSISNFIKELTPHEVAHQWWGHIVGWKSFEDQWISEGFADFSASIYLQMLAEREDYLKFWERSRQAILEKGVGGYSANDVGPISLGIRLETAGTRSAYSRLVYNKGGYVLHMLRWIMFERQTGDQRFINMMRDFVQEHFNKNASTEDFKKSVEKHMKPAMDLDKNGSMDWFFDQWVYGTEIPSYRWDYSLQPQDDGTVLLKGAVTQSGVSENFKMVVPLYLDFDGKILRMGEVYITGNTTTPEFSVPLPKRPDRVLLNAYHDILAHEAISVER